MAWWLITIGFIVVGVLGYIEGIPGVLKICLMVLFLLLSVGQIIITLHERKKSIEDFYNSEIVTVYPQQSSKGKLEFSYNKNPKWLAIALEYKPIPKSVQLFEGGYLAPPITLAFQDNKVIFKNSAFSSYEQYENQPIIYQIRYYPIR